MAIQKSGGCLSTLLAGGVATFALIGVAVVGCIGLCLVIVIAIGAGAQQNQQAAIEANNGYGAKDNPIPRGQVVIFENFNITPLQMTWPATTQIMAYSGVNEPPAVGTEYVLVYFQVDCKRTDSTVCRGYDFKVRLVDDEGREWGEPTVLIIEDSLELKEAIGGSAIQGWQAFEFPQGKRMASIKLWITGGAELYVRPPQQ